MSYKFSTGSVRKGDIYFEDDREGEATYIDFGQDTITLRPSGSQIFHVTSASVGIGTTNPTEMLTIHGPVEQAQPAIQFMEANANRAKIFINSSNNLEIKQQFTNKHIVFKVLDAGTTREAFRMDGAVPEVVVNQTGDSLVDFRVESNNNTHMLFVDGGNDKIGINTNQPSEALDINSNSIRLRNSLTPSSASALGAAGQICWDQSYLYICVATDTWRRIPHDTW